MDKDIIIEFLDWLKWNCDIEGNLWQYCDGTFYSSEDIFQYWINNIKQNNQIT
jgi:hypothetical protein